MLPSGFHRIRHYGLLANAQRRENLAKARELLAQLHDSPTVQMPCASPEASIQSVRAAFVCPDCGAAMIVLDTIARTPLIRAPPPSQRAA